MNQQLYWLNASVSRLHTTYNQSNHLRSLDDTDRQTERQTDRQTYIHTATQNTQPVSMTHHLRSLDDRQTDRQTERQTDRHTATHNTQPVMTHHLRRRLWQDYRLRHLEMSSRRREDDVVDPATADVVKHHRESVVVFHVKTAHVDEHRHSAYRRTDKRTDRQTYIRSLSPPSASIH